MQVLPRPNFNPMSCKPVKLHISFSGVPIPGTHVSPNSLYSGGLGDVEPPFGIGEAPAVMQQKSKTLSVVSEKNVHL